MLDFSFLFVKELKSEWKNRYALFALLLQIVIAGFIVYTISNHVSERIWHSFFYVILIFGIIQNIGRSFLAEHSGTILYYKFVARPEAIILSKMLYQFLVNIIFLMVLLVVMKFFLPASINHFYAYVVTAVLFVLANVAVFTFNAAIALGAKNSSLIASILSLPLLIPGLLIALKSASLSLEKMGNEINFYQDWAILILLIVMIVSLSIILFKFVWKD